MDKDEILEAIKQMTVMDLADMVKAMESEFGISAAAPIAVAAAAPAAAAAAGDGSAGPPAEEEQFEFAVLLQDIGANKINVIKAVREVTTLGLREAKELVEGAPARVKEAVAKEEAEKVKATLEGAGATVKIE